MEELRVSMIRLKDGTFFINVPLDGSTALAIFQEELYRLFRQSGLIPEKSEIQNMEIFFCFGLSSKKDISEIRELANRALDNTLFGRPAIRTRKRAR